MDMKNWQSWILFGLVAIALSMGVSCSKKKKSSGGVAPIPAPVDPNATNTGATNGYKRERVRITSAGVYHGLMRESYICDYGYWFVTTYFGTQTQECKKWDQEAYIGVQLHGTEIPTQATIEIKACPDSIGPSCELSYIMTTLGQYISQPPIMHFEGTLGLSGDSDDNKQFGFEAIAGSGDFKILFDGEDLTASPLKAHLFFRETPQDDFAEWGNVRLIRN